MKNRKTSAVSFITAIILVVSSVFLSGCVSKKIDQDLTVSKNNPITTAEYVSEEASADVSADNGVSLPADVTEASELSGEFVLPQTIPDIVELFNKAANRIKPEASKVVKNYEKRIVDEEKLVVPKVLDSTARGLMNTFMKDDTEPIVYSTREEIVSEYIVPGQSYASRLTADSVETATCTDKGNEYVIYIKLKDEKNPVTGKGVGSVCDIIEANEVSEKVSFIESFTTDYYDCEVEMTVDKATGRVVHAKYSVPLVFGVTVNLFGTHSGNVGLTFIKDYTITY